MPVGDFHDRPDPSAFRVVHALHDLVLDVVEDMASAPVFFPGTDFGADFDEEGVLLR